MTMPAKEGDRTATGRLVAQQYCPGCSQYSGVGVCWVYQRGHGDYSRPIPEPANKPKEA